MIATELQRRLEAGPDLALVADQEAIQRRLTTLERQQVKLLRTFREADEDAVPWELVKRELAQIEQEKVQLQTTLADIERRLAEQQAVINQLDTLAAYCQRVGQNLETFGFNEKCLTLEALAVTVKANRREWCIRGSIPLSDDAGILSQTSGGYVPLLPPLLERV
jgi:hypothetical protein